MGLQETMAAARAAAANNKDTIAAQAREAEAKAAAERAGAEKAKKVGEKMGELSAAEQKMEKAKADLVEAQNGMTEVMAMEAELGAAIDDETKAAFAAVRAEFEAAKASLEQSQTEMDGLKAELAALETASPMETSTIQTETTLVTPEEQVGTKGREITLKYTNVYLDGKKEPKAEKIDVDKEAQTLADAFVRKVDKDTESALGIKDVYHNKAMQKDSVEGEIGRAKRLLTQLENGDDGHLYQMSLIGGRDRIEKANALMPAIKDAGGFSQDQKKQAMDALKNSIQRLEQFMKENNNFEEAPTETSTATISAEVAPKTEKKQTLAELGQTLQELDKEITEKERTARQAFISELIKTPGLPTLDQATLDKLCDPKMVPTLVIHDLSTEKGFKMHDTLASNIAEGNAFADAFDATTGNDLEFIKTIIPAASSNLMEMVYQGKLALKYNAALHPSNPPVSWKEGEINLSALKDTPLESTRSQLVEELKPTLQLSDAEREKARALIFHNYGTKIQMQIKLALIERKKAAESIESIVKSLRDRPDYQKLLTGLSGVGGQVDKQLLPDYQKRNAAQKQLETLYEEAQQKK